jgi:hypothetical protein
MGYRIGTGVARAERGAGSAEKFPLSIKLRAQGLKSVCEDFGRPYETCSHS